MTGQAQHFARLCQRIQVRLFSTPRNLSSAFAGAYVQLRRWPRGMLADQDCPCLCRPSSLPDVDLKATSHEEVGMHEVWRSHALPQRRSQHAAEEQWNA